MPFLALVLAWLVPGAGHYYVGRKVRGVVIFLTLSAMFWTGVALGGVMTVDARGERWWFVADMFTGVHGLVSYQRQKAVYADPKIFPPQEAMLLQNEAVVDERLAKAGIVLAHPGDTVARTYAGIAGFLNLMCMFDAVMLALMGQVGEPSSQKEEKGGPP